MRKCDIVLLPVEVVILVTLVFLKKELFKIKVVKNGILIKQIKLISVIF